MFSCDVWKGIDRLAFHENAILLDVKLRSQGIPTRSSVRDHGPFPRSNELPLQLVRNVLDDFALVLSGHGGKDNVSAVCMENDEDSHQLTLRVASNDGVSGGKLADLEGLVQLITKKGSEGDSTAELRCNEVLTEILQQCSARFFKHVTKFVNELKQARCPLDAYLQSPMFSVEDDVTESADDVNELGPYSHTTHYAYMQLCRQRLCDLRNICTALMLSTDPLKPYEMMTLAKNAYDVRRSSSFGRFLKHNLLATQKPTAVQSMAQDLKERLGKLSKFWRAAKTLVSFGSVVSARNTTIQILCLPASRQEVQELCQRTLMQLHSRGGKHFKLCNDVQLQQKLRQWSKYRLHCEMQLVVFYQENPHLQLSSCYIGCDKLACYLCYAFITAHGHFQTKGCHQGLYSLWTVPRTISFENVDRAFSFQNALRCLANTLEQRMESLRRAPKVQWKHKSNHESTAHLSRISLLSTFATVRPMIAESTENVSGAVKHKEHAVPPQSANIKGSGLFSIAESLGGEDDPDKSKEDRSSPIRDNAASVEAPNYHRPEIESTREEMCRCSSIPEATSIQRPQANGSFAKRSREGYSKRHGQVQWHHRDRKRRKKRRQPIGQSHRSTKDNLQRRGHRVRSRPGDKLSQRHSSSTPRQSSGANPTFQYPGADLWHYLATVLSSCFRGCTH